ncbi:MAG: acetate kinase [Syntrophales bacterium]|nr:acetate kinase [Syntrophales bacterium]
MAMKILVLNCGGSSVKYKLYDMESGRVVALGFAERIGLAGSGIRHQAEGAAAVSFEHTLRDHREALEILLGMRPGGPRAGSIDPAAITAIGHRVVHGGEYFRTPVIIDDAVLVNLKACSTLAPLHNPHNLAGIEVCRKLLTEVPQVAVFDTAFHQTMPPLAYTYAIPHRYYDTYRIRKYGFHGTSHRYVAERAAELAGRPLAELKIVTCHLGAGCSLCAVRDGHSIDTTMGFTPLAGVVMGTRSGDIDPALVPFIADKEGLPPAAVMDILNSESGVFGISGISGDFRDLLKAAREGNERATLALDVFTYSIAKGIGSLLPALEGLDALVFTAGIGENSPDIRRLICRRLAYFGITLDDGKNALARTETDVATTESRVRIYVIPTDEERMIARETRKLIDPGRGPG